MLVWTVADDQGFFDGNLRSLLGELYPHDDGVDEATLAAELDELGPFLDWYATPDGPIGKVRNWKRHQRIQHPKHPVLERIVRESGVKLPRFPRNPHEGFTKVSGDLPVQDHEDHEDHEDHGDHEDREDLLASERNTESTKQTERAPAAPDDKSTSTSFGDAVEATVREVTG